MNPVILCVIIALILFGLLFLLIKNLKLHQLNQALKANDMDRVLVLTKEKMIQRFLSEYVLDLYAARALYLKKDEVAFLDQLRSMMKKTYDAKDEEQYLTLYFHIFVHLKRIDSVDELLSRIRQTKHESFIHYCEWTKAVLLDGTCDLCSDIEQAIEAKEYYGFPLATCSYLIGHQKKQLGIYQDAIEWLETALDVFLDHDIYVTDVKKEIEELHAMGYESMDKNRKRPSHS